jgi:hypothetical protein
MKLDKAEKIIKEYGFFLEHINPVLMKIFGVYIPEHFLPHTKEEIHGAMAKVKEIYAIPEIAENSVNFLMFYKDNDEALKNFDIRLLKAAIKKKD